MVSRRVQSRLVAGLVAVAVLAAAGAAVDRATDPFAGTPFDPAAWAATNGYGRMGMARAAVRRLPPGTPEAEALALLGPAGSIGDAGGMFGTAPAGTVRTHEYYLGGNSLTSLRGMDGSFVWVHVGADGRVVATEIGGG